MPRTASEDFYHSRCGFASGWAERFNAADGYMRISPGGLRPGGLRRTWSLNAADGRATCERSERCRPMPRMVI